MTESTDSRETGRRPEGVSDETIGAVGKVSEALEFVEEFDDDYWTHFRDHERRVRDELQPGARHVFEAEMKEDRRTRGRSGHEGRP